MKIGVPYRLLKYFTVTVFKTVGPWPSVLPIRASSYFHPRIADIPVAEQRPVWPTAP